MNQLERCAAVLSRAVTDPVRARVHFVDAHVDLRRIVRNTAKRRITNPCLIDDAMQNVSLRIWRRITEKPGTVSPVELRMLIDGTISNTIRDDTRARRRNGTPTDAVADDERRTRYAHSHDADGNDPTHDRVVILERMEQHAA